MCRSSRSRISWLFNLAFVYPFFLIGQTITFQTPDEFFVCGTASFEVTVDNNTPTTLTNATVQVTFSTSSGTQCGVTYLPGTINGGGEADLSNPNAPIFSINDLAPGATVTLTFETEAPCSVVDCIDSGEFFNNLINLNWDGGNTSATTDLYVIERALLVITAIDQYLMSGSQGQVLVRSITIANTRPGALQGFLFTDSYQNGISITSNNGTIVASGPNTLQLALDGSDFAAIGDGDNLFELNESITIIEEISILDCGFINSSSVSNFTVGWGCGGEICQQVTANAIVAINPSDAQDPELIWEPITSVAECFCGPDGYRQGMKITNVGAGSALDLAFSLQMTGITAYVDTASIEADSVGNILDLQPGFGLAVPLDPPCDGPEGLVPFFILTIPELGPSQTVTIFWDAYYCDQHCNEPSINWQYRYSYFKECPPDPFVSIIGFIPVEEIGVHMNTILTSNVTGLLEDDNTYSVFYELDYDSLDLLNDELVLEIELPCGLNWVDDNDMLLNGQAPIDLVQEIMPFSNLITATYQLPLSGDSASTEFEFTFNCEDLCLPGEVCEDSLVTSCVGIDTCIVDPPQITGIEVKTTINKCPEYPLSCNMQECNFIIFSHDCPIDSICVNEPPGYVNYRFGAARSNYGLPDNNDDRLADAGGQLNFSLVRGDRLIAGDTIHASLGGEVVMDQAGASLPFGNVTMVFRQSDFTGFNSGNIITDGSGISEVRTMIRIYDSSSGIYYDCDNPDAIIDMEFNLNYIYDISSVALGPCVPATFSFEAGDSILFEGDYRLEYNVVREPDPTPLCGKLSLSPEIIVFDSDTTLYDPIVCGCAIQVFEVSGYEYEILPGIFGVPECKPSQYVGGSLFRLLLKENNFFPFEHRNLLKNLDWRLAMPPQIVLNEARMTFMRYMDGSVIFANEILDPVFANGEDNIDFGQYQDPNLDEGFSALFQYIFESDCTINGSLPLTITSTIDFAPGLPEAADPFELTVNANALRALIPNLFVESPLCDLTSANNQMVFNFDFGNFPSVVASQMSGAAPNTWMYVSSATGLVTDFQLVNLETGDTIPSINGVFQLDTFSIDTVEMQLIATNNSCEREDLILHYGWTCDPFTSQVQTACYRRSKPLSIFSPPGEIDFLIESPFGCFDLCDTIDFHSLQIFNGQLGSVYELFANAQLPPGLSILPGSSQVEYPTGSGNFFPIDDPDILNNTIAQWNLTNFTALENGLPGINAAPANSINLQFLALTDCDFIADAFVLFSIAAEQNCGIPSNTVAKPGEEICINGVTQPYSSNINAETEPGFGCADEVVFDVSMTASVDLPAGACIIVSLPPGIVLVPNSCSSACQNDFNCNPVIDGNNYTWQLPEGVTSNQIVCFEFSTSGWGSLGCEEGLVIFRTANETQALCAATGDSCSTKVNTGSLLFPYEIKRPAYMLDNFTINASEAGNDDLVEFSLDVINSEVQNEPPIIVDFYIDTDGNGSGDQLVHTENLVAILANGQFETLTGNFTMPAGNLCNLVAYINPDQCACSLDSAFVTTSIEYQTNQAPTVCSGDEIMIGVEEQAGFTYQWNPSDCLSPDNAPMTTFSCENDGSSPITYQFILAETDAATCEINNLIDVTVQPIPGIAFFESPICAGQSTNIAATQGDTYIWDGPGITDPSLQIQTVTPSVTSVYSVTATDAFGCMGSESVMIEVMPLPIADAGEDIMVCPGVMPMLNAVFNENYDYLWSPAIANGVPTLSNASLHNPEVLVMEETTFTLTVTEDGCSSTDEVTVSFSDMLDLGISDDVTICLGSSTILTASGADTYTWTPAGDCQNADCSAVLVSPVTTTAYTVMGSTIDGCEDVAVITVTVTTDTIFTNDIIEICEGETATIHGMTENTSGTYTFSTTLPAGCDSVSNVELIVNPLPDSTLLNESICGGTSYDFQGQTLTESGVYMETLISANGCDSVVELTLTVIEPELEIIFMPGDTLIEGDTLFMSISPANYDSIIWSNGEIMEACTNQPNCSDVPLEDTEYSVTVFDENGCSTTALQLITVTIQCFPEKVEVPNVFTPNGDGVNDVFDIVSLASEQVINMRVWNRWGKKIYDGTGPWDGSETGSQAVGDVFIYSILVGCPAGLDEEEELYKGDVTLLR